MMLHVKAHGDCYLIIPAPSCMQLPPRICDFFYQIVLYNRVTVFILWCDSNIPSFKILLKCIESVLYLFKFLRCKDTDLPETLRVYPACNDVERHQLHIKK